MRGFSRRLGGNLMNIMAQNSKKENNVSILTLTVIMFPQEIRF